MKNLMIVASVALLGGIFASNANATLKNCDYYAVSVNHPHQNKDGGNILNLKASYKATGDDLAWYATFGKSPANGKKTNGFWLAINDGPNPKGTADELAIFYMDVTDISKPILTAYAYNGLNGDSSFKDGNGDGHPDGGDKIWSSTADPSIIKELVAKDNADGTRTIGFRIDPTVINGHAPLFGSSANWTGAKFDKKIGWWFHPVNGLKTAYSNDFLTKWQYDKQGWSDYEHFATQCSDNPVPEPATLAALGLGVAAMARKRCRA